MEKPWLKFYDEGVPHSLEYPEMTVPDLLRESAQRFPDRVATIFFGGRLTYSQLQEQVNRFATALAGLGVKKGDRVAIMLPNTPQTIIAFYAVETLGAITVMTNPLYVERELKHQWTDAGVEVAVILDRLWPRVKAVREQTPVRHIIVTGLQDYLPFPKNLLYGLQARREGTWISVPREEGVLFFKELVRQHPPSPPAVTIQPDDLATLQYTGGTTGVPKGAMLTHRNLVAQVTQLRHYVFHRSEDGEECVVGVMPFFHAYGLNAVLNGSVSMASSLIVIPRFDVKTIVEAIEKERPTFFAGVPTMFVALNKYAREHKVDLTSIKTCFSGAAPLPVEVLHEFERLTGARIAEGYGLTEGTVASIINPMWGKRKAGSIGVPLPDMEARIVDVETGTQDMPIGEPGELILRGPTVMKGYWNKPEETAQVLRHGWLYTGDIATMDEEGYFYIVDRKKDMIIAGGYNIYPREIEEVLYEHPKVLEAVAVGVPDPYRGETVKVFIVLRPGESATEDEIIAFCRERLAAYKVPRLVEFRSELPKTLVGKILRRALREEELARAKS